MTATYDPEEELRAELRAVREELARRDHGSNGVLDATLVSPPRDHLQARLMGFTVEQLEEHEQRIERDLADLDLATPDQLYRPTDEDTT